MSAVDVDFAWVLGHVHGAIAHIAPTDSVDALEHAGVHVLRGTGHFTGPHGLEVAGSRVAFRQALLATGAAPAMPPIPGLGEAHALTSDTIWG